MRDVLILFLHLIVTVVRLARPGGLRYVVAESLLVKHQLRILNRGRKRAPNLCAAERWIAGLCTLFMSPARVRRSAIVVRPSTLLHLHRSVQVRIGIVAYPLGPGRHGSILASDHRVWRPMPARSMVSHSAVCSTAPVPTCRDG